MRSPSSRVLRLLPNLLFVLVIAANAQADVYWDINGSTPGTGAAPSGAWDLTTANWSASADGDVATTTWTDGETAIFTAGTLGIDAVSSYTVTVSGSLAPNGIVNAMSGTLALSGGTLSIGSGGILCTANAGATTIGSSLTVAAGQTWTNNGSGLLNITGPVVINNPLALAGTGVTQLSAANSGFGSVSVTGGTIQIGNNAAFGFGPLNLLGGTLTTSTGGSGGNRIISNDLTINGTVAFGNAAFSGFSLTFNGANMNVAADSVISNSNNNGLIFSSNPVVLGGNLTVDAGATPSLVAFSGGLTVSGGPGGNRTLVLNNAGAAATISGPLSGTDLNQTLTLAGSGTNNSIGAIATGSLAPMLVVDSSTGGVFTFNAVNSYAGGVTIRNGTVVVAQSSSGGNGPFGSGALTLSGGTIRADSISDRTVGNDLSISGAFTTTFIQSTASGRKLTFTPSMPAAISGGPTLRFNGAGGAGVQFNSGQSVSSGTLSIVQDNSAPVLFAGGMTILSGGGLDIAQNSSGPITIQNSLSLAEDMAVVINGSGNVTLNFTSGLNIVGNRIITVSGSGAGLLDFVGPGPFSADAANRTLTIDTSYAPAGLPGINIGSLQQTTSDPALVISGPGRVRFNGGGGTFAGGTTFIGGPTILVANSTTGLITSGPFGVGKINVGSGAKLLTADTTARTLANDVDFLGDVTLGAPSGSANITWNGNVSVFSAAPDWTLAGNTMIFGTFGGAGTLTIDSSVTTGWRLAGPGNIELNNGFAFGSNAKLIADSTGNFYVRGSLSGGSNTLTLTGSHPGILFGRDVSGNNNDYRVRGTTGGVVIDGANVVMGGAQRNASNAIIASSDFTGGVTLLNGVLLIANTSSFVSSGALASSPVGLGTLTLSGGTIGVSGTTARTLNNNLVVNGNVVFGSLGAAALTINPTVVSSPSQGAISITGNRTLRFLSDVTLGGAGAGFAGISGDANATKIGPGRLTLINSTSNNNTAAWTVGDNNLATASTTAGGVLQVNSQSALGVQPVAVNFGGTLNPSGNFSLSNAISFAAGATFNPTAATGGIQLAQSNPVSFASGSVLNNGSGQTLTLHGVNLTLPSAGVFVNNSTGNGSTSITTSWPSLTGDMFFVGSGSHALNTRSIGSNPAMVLSSVDGEARTIVFSMSTGRTMLNNVRLNADLTLDGGGSPMVGAGGNEAGSLGSVTTNSGDSFTIVKRGPNAVAIATGSTFSGALIVKEGAIQINNTNSTTAIFPNATITLDGGAIRVFDNTNNSTNFTSNIAVTSAGGGWEAYSTNNSGSINYSGSFSGPGQISLRYGGPRQLMWRR